MLHPSCNDLLDTINQDVEPGEEPIVNSRYSIVIATAKRARQLIGGDERLVGGSTKKPLSVAVEEVAEGKVTIVGEDDIAEEEIDV